MEFLTQKELKEMLSLAYQRVKENEEEINKINVFPVPDQDTGTNLRKTLEGPKEILNQDFPNLKEFSKVVLEKTLISAQGNVGVIFTGFLLGFLEGVEGEKIQSSDFVKFFRKGAERAKKSISEPKEGTILDVIGAAATTLEKEFPAKKDLRELLMAAVEAAKEALLLTREKREVFKKANVVDAGGLGFLIVLKSFLEVLGEKKEMVWEKEKEKRQTFFQIISHRFEVIALISCPQKKQLELKNSLESLGDSLEIVSLGELTKIHIHTDFPEEVKKVLKNFGEIKELKVEDMTKQIFQESLLEQGGVGIVVENVAALSEKLIEKYEIEVVPVKYEWAAVEKFPGNNIWEKMRNAKEEIKEGPKTSQATPFDYLKAYQQQLQKFNYVLTIALSSKLSGSYNSALQAKEMLPENERERVFVVDSLQAGPGQALLVLKAIELMQEGKSVEEIQEKIKAFIPQVRFYVFLKTGKWLASIGRITPSQAKWIERMKKLHLNPFLQLKDGILQKGGIVFAKDEVEAIVKKIKKETKGKARVVISHCDNLKAAQKLKERLKEIGCEIPFISLGPEIFALLGPDALLVGFHLME